MLHQWNRLATPVDGMDIIKLTALCEKMENIRILLDIPINVHCMFRSHDYNKQIGAPPNDVHSMNLACDFDCLPKMTCDEVKAKLLPQLEQLGIRMENNGVGASWVHIDTHPVIHQRYFNP
jgi:hypothetical protein